MLKVEKNGERGRKSEDIENNMLDKVLACVYVYMHVCKYIYICVCVCAWSHSPAIVTSVVSRTKLSKSQIGFDRINI